MSAASTSHDLMSIWNVETKKAILMMAPSSASGYRGTQEKNVVVFHQAGDRYFLAAVKTDTVSGRIAPSKVERKLAEDGNQPVAAVIVAALSGR